MDNNFGFGSYFGLDLPKEEKKEKKTETKKNSGKKKANSSKKDKIYKMPVIVHTEWGDLTISDVEDLTLSKISKKLPNADKLELIDREGDLFAFIKTGSSLNDKQLSENSNETTVFIAGNHLGVCNCSSKKDLENAVILNYPELSDNKFTLSKVSDRESNCYTLRLDNSVNLSLKVSGEIRIGFLGTYEKMKLDETQTLKEVVTKFESSYPWISKIDIDWFWSGSSNTVIAQFAKAKNSSKELIVKLPVSIRFLHDAGELSDGLTSDMFEGKEYVSSKEILEVVNKYFPDIYNVSNTQITYVDPVNTVCIMRQGRSKGCTNAIGTYNSYTEKYNFFLPKIPYSVLDEIINFFKEKLPNEALVDIVYDKETKEYSILKPLALTTETRVFWDELSVLTQLKPSQAVVCEIHSHNTMHAFFSSVDNKDEVQPLLYGVIGKLDGIPEILLRARIEKDFYPVLVCEVFM